VKARKGGGRGGWGGGGGGGPTPGPQCSWKERGSPREARLDESSEGGGESRRKGKNKDLPARGKGGGKSSDLKKKGSQKKKRIANDKEEGKLSSAGAYPDQGGHLRKISRAE